MIANWGMKKKDKVFIIAEAGVNHNGNLKIAKRLVDVARLAGADAVKFQTFKAENLVVRNSSLANYQKITQHHRTQFAMLKDLELSENDFIELSSYCKKRGIIFLSTPFDIQAAKFLNGLHMPFIKISSGDLTNIPFLSEVAGFKKPIILSTGMADLFEVAEAVGSIQNSGNNKIILLHCVSNYPAEFEDINLRAINKLKIYFNLPVGYSDHTIGLEAVIAAVAMGASIIEKHFTLNRNMKGPDHRASIEPQELNLLVKAVRNIEKAFGDGLKNPRKSEFNTRRVARKSIVTAVEISKGEILKKEMLEIKRPGTGIPPKFLNKLIGKRARISIKKDRLLSWADIF